jgi:hypothetical protein
MFTEGKLWQMKANIWTEIQISGLPPTDWNLTHSDQGNDYLKLTNLKWSTQDDLRIFQSTYDNFLTDKNQCRTTLSI